MIVAVFAMPSYRVAMLGLLRKEVADSGLSRSEIARRAGITPANLTTLLGNDDANPTLATVDRVLAAIYAP